MKNERWMPVSWVCYRAVSPSFNPLFHLKEILHYMLDDEMLLILFAIKILVSRAKASLEVNESPQKIKREQPQPFCLTGDSVSQPLTW